MTAEPLSFVSCLGLGFQILLKTTSTLCFEYFLLNTEILFTNYFFSSIVDRFAYHSVHTPPQTFVEE